MARHKNFFDKEHDRQVMEEFEAWACAYFNFDKEQFNKFMRFIELLHGYQTINVKKTMLYIKAHKDAVVDGKVQRKRVLEIATSLNICDTVASAYIYRDTPTITEMINWEQSIS